LSDEVRPKDIVEGGQFHDGLAFWGRVDQGSVGKMCGLQRFG
jgi:hypothetical protein